MEVDPHPHCKVASDDSCFNTGNQANGNGSLKRSNSAPMINLLLGNLQQTETSSLLMKSGETSRIRRFSSSNASLQSLTPSTPIRIPERHRINQLKHEEIHIVDREKAHEKEIQSAMQMSSSWDEFHLEGQQDPMLSDLATRRPRSFSESLHIFTSPNILCGSPSPTRVGKQCFSPSMQIPVKNAFTPSPSPSPTRKSFARSLSPIAIHVRPSPLGKRKLDTEGPDRFDNYFSPPKKFNTGSSTPDRVLQHPLTHSISSSSLEESSPEQTVPRNSDTNISSEFSHSKSNMYAFVPVRDNRDSMDMQTTDSETSDITESTDMSTDHHMSSCTEFEPIKSPHL